MPTEFTDAICMDYLQKVHGNSPSAKANYITDSNKTFQSRSRGSLIDSDSNAWLVATTASDSDSDSDFVPLL